MQPLLGVARARRDGGGAAAVLERHAEVGAHEAIGLEPHLDLEARGVVADPVAQRLGLAVGVEHGLGAVALGGDQARREQQLQAQGGAVALHARLDARQHRERVAQVVDRLDLGRACRRVARRQLPLDERVAIEPGFGLVHRQQLGARRGLLRPALLQEPHHLGMQRNAVARPQRGVGGVAHQGVLERVHVAALRAHQTRVDERGEIVRRGSRRRAKRRSCRTAPTATAARTRDRGRRRPERYASRRRGRRGAPSTGLATMPARPARRRDRRRADLRRARAPCAPPPREKAERHRRAKRAAARGPTGSGMPAQTMLTSSRAAAGGRPPSWISQAPLRMRAGVSTAPARAFDVDAAVSRVVTTTSRRGSLGRSSRCCTKSRIDGSTQCQSSTIRQQGPSFAKALNHSTSKPIRRCRWLPGSAMAPVAARSQAAT